MKTKVAFLSVIFASLLLVSFAIPIIGTGYDVEYGPMAKKLPSNGEIFSWITDLWKMGAESFYGYRMPGTPPDHEAANYILTKFQEFGLENTFLEPQAQALCLPDKWSLTIHVGGEDVAIPCYFFRYVAWTPPEGITAEMVYVGTGSATEFKAVNDTVGVKGKIAVVDVYSLGIDVKAMFGFDWPDSFFTYYPEGLPPEHAMENWPVANLGSSYSRAVTYGAVGYVGILTQMVGKVNQYLHWYANYQIPGVSVSPIDGDYLRSLLAAGPVEATIVLTGFTGVGVTYNVYGFLPGKNPDEIIVVQTHYDGWATNEASGISVLMAIAKYFAQFPKESRERTLMFVGTSSHFGRALPSPTPYYRTLMPKIVCANVMEMIGKEYKVVDGEWVDTGVAAPMGWAVSGQYVYPLPGAVNPYLLSWVAEAIAKYHLGRSSTYSSVAGESGKWRSAKIPFIAVISINHPQFTNRDTPDTVMVDYLTPMTAAFITMIMHEDVTPKELMGPVGT